MAERDHRLEQAIEVLKAPVSLDSALDQRIMAEIAAGPAPKYRRGPGRRTWEWLKRGRTIRVSPIGGLAAAAAFAALILAGRAWLVPETPIPASLLSPAVEPSVAQFVLVAPAATTVSLVGDFNDWSSSATPMLRAEGNGVWSVSKVGEACEGWVAYLVAEK